MKTRNEIRAESREDLNVLIADLKSAWMFITLALAILACMARGYCEDGAEADSKGL